ncbi:MAG: hypothetical protein ACYDBL_14865, partial [Candidatus Acidiferrales bacterium]
TLSAILIPCRSFNRAVWLLRVPHARLVSVGILASQEDMLDFTGWMAAQKFSGFASCCFHEREKPYTIESEGALPKKKQQAGK